MYVFNLVVKYSLTQTCFTLGSHNLLEEKFCCADNNFGADTAKKKKNVIT